MKLSELSEAFKLAIDTIRSNKMRSLLASLGVVIGISFVILMGWVLTGLDQAMEDTFNILGSDMLYVDKWDWAGGANWKDIQARKNITIEDANKFCSRIRTAELCTPSVSKWGASIKYRSDLYQGINVVGTRSEYGLTPGGNVTDGRFFTSWEDHKSSNVIVIGSKVAETIFGGEQNPIGQELKINGRKYEIIGVLKKQGTMFLDFIDNQVFIPLTEFLSTFGRTNRSIEIVVKAGSVAQLDEVRDETRGLMRSIRNLSPNQSDDFSINESKALEKTAASIRMVVWGVGIGMTALSFLVGIIGIMNIMFVSVTERTKEIGIRKAIGAKKRTILTQIILESASLCLIGAFVSFIICSIFVYAVGEFLPRFYPSASFLSKVLPYELLVVASVVSIFVGILAGFLPARRASKLDPVEAMRNE